MAYAAVLPGQMALDGFPVIASFPQPQPKPKRPKSNVVSIKPSMSKKLEAALQSFLERQISLPLITIFGVVDEDRDPILPVVPQAILDAGWEDVVTKHSAKREGNETHVWNDEALFASHAELLHKSLEVFTHPNNMKDKLDVLCWMFAGDWLDVDGVRTWARGVAFSFNACCAICGYDETALQDFIYDKLPSEFQEILVDADAA